MRNPITPFQGWRLIFFEGVLVATFLIFGLRMYQMQVIEFTDAQIAADGNRFNQQPIASDRGVIFDRYGRILASNVPAYRVAVIPAMLPTNREIQLGIYNRLSALTGVPATRALALAGGRQVRSIEEMVLEGLGFSPYRAVIVADDVEHEVALQILSEQQDLPGVDIQIAAVRQYPAGDVMSHIIGYMGPIRPEEQLALMELGYDPAYDRVGYLGLEAYLERILSGQRGSVLREIDVVGEQQAEIERIDPIPGQNVRLTIDVDLQAAAQQALLDEITRINAERGRIVTQSGVVIAIDPRNGELLALVSYPTYDNSRFARAIDVPYYLQMQRFAEESNFDPFINQAISGLYPPGSSWKLITAAAALEEDVIDPRAQLYDPGDITLPNYYAQNDRGADQVFVCWIKQYGDEHGPVDMTRAIAQSCNVYFYQIGGGYADSEARGLIRPGGLGITDLFRYSTALGIGSTLGIELPAELAGYMPDPEWKRRTAGENWSTGDTYNAAFGQGYVSVTPLQMAASIATLINDGTLYQPTVISEFLDGEGNVTDSYEPTVMRNLNLAHVPEGEEMNLLLIEDMIIQGEHSLACLCEQTSAFYNAGRCSPENYVGSVDIDDSLTGVDIREYRVELPLNYSFRGRVCNPLNFNPNYTPAFLSTPNLEYIRVSMRETVTIGTGSGANLPYVQVAGKTGTAEYCDHIAGPLNLCEPGNWPAHAWFAAYAPYEDPEILVISFVYNGIEGSVHALPVAVDTLEAWWRLRSERLQEAE